MRCKRTGQDAQLVVQKPARALRELDERRYVPLLAGGADGMRLE
jgi:hypothetical protein